MPNPYGYWIGSNTHWRREGDSSPLYASEWGPGSLYAALCALVYFRQTDAGGDYAILDSRDTVVRDSELLKLPAIDDAEIADWCDVNGYDYREFET